jgi:hypothetical protein
MCLYLHGSIVKDDGIWNLDPIVRQCDPQTSIASVGLYEDVSTVNRASRKNDGLILKKSDKPARVLFNSDVKFLGIVTSWTILIRFHSCS